MSTINHRGGTLSQRDAKLMKRHKMSISLNHPIILFVAASIGIFFLTCLCQFVDPQCGRMIYHYATTEFLNDTW